MERNSSQAGKLLLGASYEFEYLQDSYIEDGAQPIANPNYERTTSEISALFLNYSITDKLSIETVLPWRKIVNYKIRLDNDPELEGPYVRETTGFSDAIILLKFSDYFFDDQILATFSSGLKLATGSVTDLDADGKVISETLQVGSGTVDPLFSLFLGYPSGRWLYSGSLFSRISVYENVRGYKYGNEFHGRISVNYDKSDALFIKAGLETVLTKRDTHQYGEPEDQRGGKWAYAVPGFGIRFSNNFILDVEYPWTIYYNVNESQLVPDGFLRLNLFYDWSF
ncbi:MAG: hypothetical protein H8E72_00120 [Candidatus Marinimicrobia bacterium]|nr:hypothetical protein [Candidatus Neomarinimicrobiota bacterium]